MVIHVDDGAPHVHAGPDQAGLLAELTVVWDDQDPHPMHTFDLGEYRDESHRVMVMIVESC